MDAHSTVTAEEGDRYPLKPPLDKIYMTNTLKHLVKLFVDETPLDWEQFNLLEQHSLVKEIRPGAWQLTAFGAALLKN